MQSRFRTVGIDIGGTNIKIAVLWSDGEVIASSQLPTEVEAGPEAGCSRIIAEVRALLQREDLHAAEMSAVGMACAGLVDPERNLVLDSPNLRSWEGFPLPQLLAETLGVPVFLENDVNAMAYGEWRRGAGRGTRHLVCLMLGTGVGGGLILDGQLYRGSRGSAAELGHMTIDLHGPSCTCPSRGCLERHVGAAWIVERTQQRLAQDPRPSRLRDLAAPEIQPKHLSEAADAGDAIAVEVLEETGIYLGWGLVSLVNIFNPERIVIGGGVAKAGERLFAPARRMVRAHAMGLPAAAVDIVPAVLGDEAAVVGATLLALERAAG
jgi:glucokinase